MTQQLSLIPTQANLSHIPSPKLGRADKTGVHGWTSFYASFSERFVEHTLKALNAKSGELVYDPFLGSGTTAVCAAKLGLRSTGSDIDPFACLLSRAKLAIRSDRRRVCRLLKPSNQLVDLGTFLPLAADAFTEDCLAYAGSIFRAVKRRASAFASGMNVLDVLLQDRSGEFDSEVVAVTAVCIAATKAAKLVRGSNPTWYRLTKLGERAEVSALRQATEEAVARMLNDLDDLSQSVQRRDFIIHNVDARFWPDGNGGAFADYVVTSPPYLTRIDYVVKHLPNLLMLSGLTSVEPERLRVNMVGTSKIAAKRRYETIDLGHLGPRATELVTKIRDHDSYASERYYQWIYHQYLSGIRYALERASVAMKPSATGAIVVQDAFYKDVFIDLGEILVEMLSMIGIQSEIIRSEPIKTSLRQLNPKRRRSKDVAQERVIFFSRSASTPS